MEKDVTLNNGVKMPLIGLGTYPLQGKTMTDVLVAASKIGYRAFDTAHAYGNEKSLGNSLKKLYSSTELCRSDLFITSKIGENLDQGKPDCKLFYASSQKKKKDIFSVVNLQLNEILKDLQTDYLDLLLLHWPHPDYLLEIWDAMVNIYNVGKVRAIGVSNCREWHLKKIIENSSTCPMLNQTEIHPFNTKKDLIVYCKKFSIQIQAYSPLLMMDKNLMDSLILKKIAERYKKSVPQIILRWNIQQQIMPIPKSSNPKRLSENYDIFDFLLSREDIQSIDSLNTNYRHIVESRYCPGY